MLTSRQKNCLKDLEYLFKRKPNEILLIRNVKSEFVKYDTCLIHNSLNHLVRDRKINKTKFRHVNIYWLHRKEGD